MKPILFILKLFLEQVFLNLQTWDTETDIFIESCQNVFSKRFFKQRKLRNQTLIFTWRITWIRFIHFFDELHDDFRLLRHRFEQRCWYAFVKNVDTHVVIKLCIRLFGKQCLQGFTQRKYGVVILSAKLLLQILTVNDIQLSQVTVKLSQVLCDSFDCIEMI